MIVSRFVEVARLEEIPRLGATVVEARGMKIAVFRTEDDQVFALEDKCPHKGGPLSQGIVHGCRVTCPLHGLVLELASGTAVAPDTGQARTLPTRTEGGSVSVDLDALAARTP
jgi:nitrite reductase (NADH) small subunit